jgi:hypothetical protein
MMRDQNDSLVLIWFLEYALYFILHIFENFIRFKWSEIWLYSYQ